MICNCTIVFHIESYRTTAVLGVCRGMLFIDIEYQISIDLFIGFGLFYGKRNGI